MWLWRARVVRTRSLAARLAQSGHIRLNGRRIDAAHRPVRVGDVLTIALEHKIDVLKIESLGVRRGPAVEARRLYRNISEAIDNTAAQHALGRSEQSA